MSQEMLSRCAFAETDVGFARTENQDRAVAWVINPVEGLELHPKQNDRLNVNAEGTIRSGYESEYKQPGL